MRRGLRHALFVLLVLLTTSGFPTTLRATGELSGKTLTPASNVQTGLQTALGTLIAGSLKGEITEAEVSEDQDRKVALTVRYTGFEGAKIWVEAAGSDKKTQRSIRAGEPQVGTSPPGDLEFTLSLDPSTPEGTTIRTAYLRVCVSRADRATASYIRGFLLPKTWSVALNPETMVLTVSAKPVGTTATLGASPTYQLPPKVITPAIRSMTLTPALRVAGGAPPSGTPAPSSTPAPARRAMIRPITIASPSPASGGAARQPMIAARPMMVANPVIIAKASPAASQLPRFAAMTAVGSYRFGVPNDPSPNAPKGPGTLSVEPLGQVRAEDIDLVPSHILGVFPSFYPDQNASSGVYYFLPYSYSLRWDPDQGYDFRVIYSATGTTGQGGDVAMAARLDAGIGIKERQVASELMAAYASAHSLTFTELRAMPIDSIAVSLSDDLHRYNIPSDKIAVTGLSDFLGQIDVSWVTDPVTKENLQQALIEDIGVSGRVTLYPAGHALGPIDVPIQIRLADFGTFGPFRWSRAERWRNATPYPIKLKYVNALVLDPSSRPVVYSWSLGGTAVPPHAQVQWDAALVPGWIDGQAKRLWIEYAVDGSCQSCDEDVIRSITGGVSSVGPAQITFHTITPLADAGAYEIQTQVRSRYFDPSSRDPQVRTIVLNSDGHDFTLGPVYTSDRDAEGSSGPLFEYFFELTMKDGTTYKATHWIACDDLRLTVGRHQLEEALGSLPGSH
jgi:hypothetical protein